MAELELSVVIPAYNEEKRLPRFLDDVLQRLQGRRFEVIVVDDGSQDQTRQVVLSRCSAHPNLRLIALQRNCGKGAAVRAGMLAAHGALRLFADADGATAIVELARLERAIQAGAQVAIGSREGEGTVVTASRLRRFLGRWFNRAVRLGAISGIRDTQCGFKLFTAEATQRLFGMAREDGFAFDVEVLYLGRKLGLRIDEVPVNWTEIAGSKVRLLRDGLRMLRSVMRIRARWRTGRYEGRERKATPATELTPA
ncbi:MAG TPA: glycosyltransferase family 2 protein [Planctomycetota bacterium]|nr:glycosyltransferase family 2 protein [Planctomycetota bacterium]